MKDKNDDNSFQEIPVVEIIENLKNNEINIKTTEEIWNNYLGVLIFLIVFVIFYIIIFQIRKIF